MTRALPSRIDHGVCRSRSPRPITGHESATAARNGFTLLEVLVALLILAVVMAALIRGVGLEARALAAQRDGSFGLWVAANRIAEIRLIPGVAPPGRSSGQARMGGRDWTWRAEVSATEVAGIQRIHVSVFEDDAGVDPVATLEGFDDGGLR